MKTRITTNGIARETEKAYLVNALVSYNANAPKERQIWMPKSLVKVIGEYFLDVEDWFLDKLGRENAFHGYMMRFDTPIIEKI